MKYLMISLCLLFNVSVLQGQCFKDRHNTSSSEAWTSCIQKLSPNISRGLSHWIMYDFGEIYTLGQSHFWNVNTPGRTGSGIKSAVIDYSVDGVNWQEWGTFSLEEANASGFYEGEDGPDFEDLEARYLLITALDNHGHLCTGLSEIRIETSGTVTSLDEGDLVSGKINVFPNPAKDICYIETELEQALNVQLIISDITGKTIVKQDVFLSTGLSRIPVDVSQYSSGQYIASITNESLVQNIQFTVLRDE